MVDPVFKAPLPPVNPPEGAESPAPQTPSQTQPVVKNVSPEQTNSVPPATDGQKPLSQKEQLLKRLNELKEQMIRYFWYSMGGLFLLGAFFGCAMSGGSNPAPQQTQTVSGIDKRVIPNRDKKTRLGVCGAVSATQPCLFYVLNNKSYDKIAEDFFKDVVRETGRSDFNIRLDNPLYQKQPIKPGYFAEIIVPAN